MDVLAAVMRELRFEAAGYRRLELSAPWAVEFGQGGLGLRGLHIVAEGCCKFCCDGDEALTLEAGDLIIAPKADAHVLRSRDAAKLNPISSFELAAHARQSLIEHGGGGERTTLICGAFSFKEGDHPALSGLPRWVRVSGSDRRANWLKTYVDALGTEALDAGAASDVVLARLTEALIIRALRHGVEDMAESGWLKGLGDAGVARALAAIHEFYADDWTIDTLARKAGRSRAAFAERFRELVGETPMHYLFLRRMRESARLLKMDDKGLAEIAHRVGYGSEAAFSAAFKRYAGMPPGEYRSASSEQNR